jgi:PTS system N-acetylglucosamine-specific IIC component
VALQPAALAALGGAANVRAVSAHDNRLRVELDSPAEVDGDALLALGLRGLARPSATVIHLLGDDAVLATLRG